MWLVLLSSVLLQISAYPIEESPTTGLPIQFQQDVNVVSYIQGFKTAMTEYVSSQYQNLTIRETEEVKDILEDFLTNFAKDLREAVEIQFKNEDRNLNLTKIEDGIPDETFNDINVRVRTEFPDITEETAKDIVYRLRKNLYETRQKLDYVIRKSQQAQVEINLD